MGRRWRPSGAVVCAAVACAIGLSVLVGWAFGVPILLSWVPGYVTMKLNTALCFVMASGGLFAQARAARDPRMAKLAAACSVAVLVVGTLSILEYASGWNLGIDQLLVHEHTLGPGTSSPGRMAPNTAFEFVLIAAALLAARSDSDRARRIGQACSFVALFLVLIALVGYGYGAHVLVGRVAQTRMAVHTIAAMLALGAGSLSLTADGGWLGELTTRESGRMVARRLLPAALVLPFSIGILTLTGYRAGLYDPAFGAALMAVAETVSFATLVWMCARSLNESEHGRSLASLDELTGLLNRRGFLSQGASRRAFARRLGEDALLFFVDLDGMKGINDGLGHAAGDRALNEAARVLRATFRDGDLVSRLGGDEFAVLASRASLSAAPFILSRLEAQLARLNAEPGRDFTLKLSTGTTPCLAAESCSIADLLQRADARMYEQKKNKKQDRASRAPGSIRVAS